MKTSLYCLPTPSFFKFCPIPSPQLTCHLQPPPQLFFLLSCFFGWMGDHTTFDVLFYLMIYWSTMSSLGNLVPEGPWCVFYATRSQVYWGLTYNVVFYWYSDLISQTHTAHSGASGLTHPYKCIFTPLAMCSKQLPLLY